MEKIIENIILLLFVVIILNLVHGLTGCGSVIYSKDLLICSYLPSNIVRVVKKDGSIVNEVITLEEVTEEDLLDLENIF